MYTLTDKKFPSISQINNANRKESTNDTYKNALIFFRDV